MIEAVIFDMDGLMIDTELVNYYAFAGYLGTLGVELTKEDYCVLFTGKPVDSGFNSAKEKFHVEFDIKDAIDYLISTNDQRSQNVPLKPGLIELLDYLKANNYKLAIATSSGLDRVYKLFESYNVLSYFDEIVCGPDVKRGKPAPDIFLKACEKLGVNTSEALVLEDSEAGIEAAYNAKVKVICVPDMKVPDKKHYDMLERQLDSLNDVINYLK